MTRLVPVLTAFLAAAAPAVEARELSIGGARCAMAAEAIAPAANAPAGAAPLWRLNSGAVMLTRVQGLNQGAPILLVIDLATVQFAAPEIDIMREHSVGPIGRWTNLVSTLTGPKGPGIYGSPILYTPATEAEADMWLLREAAEVQALLTRKHPWQASVEIGAPVDSYEFVAPGETVSYNGQDYTAPDGPNDPSMYVVHNGVVPEASVCLRGADTQTGPTLFASKNASTTSTKDNPMDLSALLAKYAEKHHGKIARLHAAGKKADEIASALLADDKAATDGEIADLKAKVAESEKNHAAVLAERDAKVAELQGKLDALKSPTEETEVTPPAGTDGGKATSQNAAPKTVTEGMARLQAAGVKGNGFALRKAVLAKWPGLRTAIDKLHLKAG